MYYTSNTLKFVIMLPSIQLSNVQRFPRPGAGQKLPAKAPHTNFVQKSLNQSFLSTYSEDLSLQVSQNKCVFNLLQLRGEKQTNIKECDGDV